MSKYDPANRNASGHYGVDEWTAISDIGRDFGGTTLTESAYLEVENAYLDVAIAFLAEVNVTQMTVKYDPDELCQPAQYEDGDTIAASQIRPVLRSLLREEFWCRLESSSGAFILFGYDYYMSIGDPAGGTR